MRMDRYQRAGGEGKATPTTGNECSRIIYFAAQVLIPVFYMVVCSVNESLTFHVSLHLGIYVFVSSLKESYNCIVLYVPSNWLDHHVSFLSLLFLILLVTP